MNRTLKQDKLMFPTVKLFKIQINVDIPTIVGLFFLTNKKSRFIGKNTINVVISTIPQYNRK